MVVVLLAASGGVSVSVSLTRDGPVHESSHTGYVRYRRYVSVCVNMQKMSGRYSGRLPVNVDSGVPINVCALAHTTCSIMPT